MRKQALIISMDPDYTGKRGEELRTLFKDWSDYITVGLGFLKIVGSCFICYPNDKCTPASWKSFKRIVKEKQL